MSPRTPHTAIRPPLLLGAALLALWPLSCDRQGPSTPTTPPEQPPAQPSSELPAPVTDPAPPPSDPLSDADDHSAEAARIMDQYPDLNAQELLNVPEVNPHLATALRGIAEDQELQDYINSTVEITSKFQGLEAIPGTVKLNLDLAVYDDQRTRRMLAAVLTGRPRPVVEFLVDELDEASYEFILSEDDIDISSNGISFEGIPLPPAPE